MTVDDRFARGVRETRDEEPLGTRNEIITGPVSDWASDFSHLEPEWAALLNRVVAGLGPSADGMAPTRTCEPVEVGTRKHG